MCLAQGAIAENHAISQLVAASAVGVVRGTRDTTKVAPEALHLKLFTEEDQTLYVNDVPEVKRVTVLKGKCSSVAVGTCVLSAAHCLSPQQVNLSNISARTPEGYDGIVDMSTIRTPEPWKGKNPSKLPNYYFDLAIARLSSQPPQSLSMDNLSPMRLPELLNKPLSVAGYGDMYDEGEKKEMKDVLAESEKAGSIIGDFFLKHRELKVPSRVVGDVNGYKGLGDIILADHLEAHQNAKLAFLNASTINELMRGNFTQWTGAARVLSFESAYRWANSVLVMTPNPSAVRPGDSGAPVFRTENGKRTLVGVVEGMKNKNPEEHTDATRNLPDDGSMAILLNTHRDWLLAQINDLKCFETKETPASMGEIK